MRKRVTELDVQAEKAKKEAGAKDSAIVEMMTLIQAIKGEGKGRKRKKEKDTGKETGKGKRKRKAASKK